MVKKKTARGSSTGRPLMRLLDVLGRRWTLRILWELRDGPLSFRDLQAACDDLSPTTVNTRLADLRDLGVVSLAEPGGYQVTPAGAELAAYLLGLDRWARRHLR